MQQPSIHSYQLFMKHLPYAKLSTSLGNQVKKITCMANREGGIINKLRAQRYRPKVHLVLQGGGHLDPNTILCSTKPE